MSYSSAKADELSDLREQVARMKAASTTLEKRLEKLERVKPAPVVQVSNAGTGGQAYAVKSPAAAPVNPGYIPIPGTNTSIKIGGFVKLDAIDDVKGGGIGGTGTDFRAINLNGTAASMRGNDVSFTARQTQLSFATITSNDLGDLRTFASMDFYAGTNGNGLLTNSYSPRLREAFASLDSRALGGQWLIGQTWSTFMDLQTYPETLDVGGPVGLPFIRQPMVRYTAELGGGHKLAFAVEAPFSDFQGSIAPTIITGGGIASTNEISKIPDFIGKYSYDGAWGHAAVAGLVRQIAVDTGGATVAGFRGDASVTGWGVMGALRLKTYQKDSLNLVGVGGTGVGRYLYGDADSRGGGASLVTCAGGLVACNLEATTQYGGTVSYQHYWLDNVRSNFTAGYVYFPSEFPQNLPSSVESIQSVHANVIWSPMAKTDIGMEAIYGKLALRASPGAGIFSEGEAFRLQGSVKVGF